MIQTSLVSCVVISLFAVSLVPLTELDQKTQNKIPVSIQDVYHRSVTKGYIYICEVGRLTALSAGNHNQSLCRIKVSSDD